jgi:hypothetical protein
MRQQGLEYAAQVGYHLSIAKKAGDRAWERILDDAGEKLPTYPLQDGDKVKAPFI